MGKKTKIAIATHQMVMGGIEKSLVDLCKVLIKSNIEITVYVDYLGGELLDALPREVTVIPIFQKYRSSIDTIKSAFKNKNYSKICAVIGSYINRIVNSDPVKEWEWTASYLDRVDETYDYAFAYAAPVAFSVVFVARLLSAKKKYAWIHNDCNELTLDITKYPLLFENYDKILCVSQMARESFLAKLPQYVEKTEVFYNVIDEESILRLGNEYCPIEYFRGTKLLTVGRVCPEKGQDIIPSICKKLIASGFNIRWYCVGDGENRELVETEIHRLHLGSHVILVGSKKNPYPFFKSTDIYVQPSRHEGFGITLTEAKLFQLPIVTTNFDGANEQIENNETGLIVNFDEKELYNAIVMLITNNELRRKFKMNLMNDKKNCRYDLSVLFDGGFNE